MWIKCSQVVIAEAWAFTLKVSLQPPAFMNIQKPQVSSSSSSSSATEFGAAPSLSLLSEFPTPARASAELDGGCLGFSSGLRRVVAASVRPVSNALLETTSSRDVATAIDTEVSHGALGVLSKPVLAKRKCDTPGCNSTCRLDTFQ